MKIQVFHIISNKVWGGGERYALDLCNESAKQGYKVTAIVRLKSVEVADMFRAAGIDTMTLGLGGVFDIVSAIKLSKIIDRAAAECERVVVHIHNFKDATVALRARALSTNKAKIKVVCSRHLVARAKNDLSHISIYNSLDDIIFVSKLAYDTFLSGKPDIDRKKLHIVHNSIVAPEPVEQVSRDKLTVLFTGRIVPEKGLETLIRAIALTKDNRIKLNICGTGNHDYIIQLKQVVSDLNITDRVNWLGHVDNIWLEIHRADIGVMPSIWAEPFGLSLLEYMSQGLAVITTSSGAQAEIVSDGIDCLVVPPADEEKLAAAIDRFAADSDMRKSYGKAARMTYLTRFSYDRFFKAITGIYTS